MWNLSSHAKVRSTRILKAWIAALNNRFRPRLGVLRLRGFSLTLIGSRALAAYGDVDGPSVANNHPGSRKCTARLLRRSDASASAHGCAGIRSVRRGGAGNVG